jgi:ankyrin repeat protein
MPMQGLLVDEHMLSEHSRPLSVTKSRKHSRRAHSLTQNLENMNQQLFRCRTNIRELELSFTLIRNLCEASVSGDVAGIQTTLAKGVGVNESDEMGACALHYACSGGSEDACALLLDAGADVNGQLQ